MNNNNIVKLVAIILIPVIIFFARSYIQEFLSSNGGIFLDLTPVENIEKVVQQNSASVDILKQYNANYIPGNVLAGVNPKNLNNYFAPPVEEKKPELEAEKPKVDIPIPKKKPRIQLPPKPNYVVDFVLVGDNGKYISLGGSLLEIGDKTPQGEVIQNIEANRIQLLGKWGLRWVPVNY